MLLLLFPFSHVPHAARRHPRPLTSCTSSHVTTCDIVFMSQCGDLMSHHFSSPGGMMGGRGGFQGGQFNGGYNQGGGQFNGTDGPRKRFKTEDQA
jgi:hypothetical protein